jgi:hypothetical protein
MLVRYSLLFMGALLPVMALPGQAQAPVASATAPLVDTPSTAATQTGQVVVPVSTTIPLELRNTLTSRTAYVGQAIYCTTIYPIAVNNRIVIPVGTYVKGRITQVIRPGHVKGKAQIGLRFEEITLPSGVTKPLRAALSGFGGSGQEGFSPKEGKIQGESSKGKDVQTVAITAAEGAGIGSVAGISGDHSGAGAGIGGAAGALGGLVYVLATRGKELVLSQGTNLELELAAPLTFYRDEIDSSSTDPSGPALSRRDPGPGL